MNSENFLNQVKEEPVDDDVKNIATGNGNKTPTNRKRKSSTSQNNSFHSTGNQFDLLVAASNTDLDVKNDILDFQNQLGVDESNGLALSSSIWSTLGTIHTLRIAQNQIWQPIFDRKIHTIDLLLFLLLFLEPIQKVCLKIVKTESC